MDHTCIDCGEAPLRCLAVAVKLAGMSKVLMWLVLISRHWIIHTKLRHHSMQYCCRYMSMDGPSYLQPCGGDECSVAPAPRPPPALAGVAGPTLLSHVSSSPQSQRSSNRCSAQCKGPECVQSDGSICRVHWPTLTVSGPCQHCVFVIITAGGSNMQTLVEPTRYYVITSEQLVLIW